MLWNETAILVQRAQAGDRTAYGELVSRFQATVYALALARLRDPSEAQELTQEVFVHGMMKLDQLREPSAFPGWLRQITVRMALNRLTRRGPLRNAEDEVLENAHVEERSPLEEMVRAEQHEHLYAGLARLKPMDQAALIAFYIRGRSLKQMSREFETPVGTIKRRLHVARQRLRDQLEETGAQPDRRQRANPRAPRRELMLT
jgi:RNA polymerase sigma-70 factor (ECF subfamily)